MHGFVLGSGLLPGASDSGTINVTLSFSSCLLLTKTAVVAVAVALGLGADQPVRAIAPGSVLHGATYAAPPDSHRALLKRRSGSCTAPGPPG
jgi:hypothetical protein